MGTLTHLDKIIPWGNNNISNKTFITMITVTLTRTIMLSSVKRRSPPNHSTAIEKTHAAAHSPIAKIRKLPCFFFSVFSIVFITLPSKEWHAFQVSLVMVHDLWNCAVGMQSRKPWLVTCEFRQRQFCSKKSLVFGCMKKCRPWGWRISCLHLQLIKD